MARRLRIEYEGAIYHVLNRGNYRRDLFESGGEAMAFVKTLEEAVAIYGWCLHAYTIMRNHYHLALETPQPNLVDGMHWLQSTFATRFNRFHRERGHLFQGRYQAILVENDASLARVVDYIHLNPVRAKIIEPEHMAVFRWSSLGRFMNGRRCDGMTPSAWLSIHGLKDNCTGWSSYEEHLKRLSADVENQKRLGFENMSRGWAIGTEGWRKALAKDYAQKALYPGLEADEIRAMKEASWTECFNRLLTDEGKSLEELKNDKKSARWKIALAVQLRQETGAPIKWIAHNLHMGSQNSVRSYLSRCGKQAK